MKNEIKPVVEEWAKKNGITIKSFSYQNWGNSSYNEITVYWDGFKELSPTQMSAIVNSWNANYKYSLKYIVSDGEKYSVNTNTGKVYYDGSTIAFGSSSSGSSSGSKPDKTATCNYCNGTGKVNGETCPWCNGSGMTYDNYFNDILG